MANTFIFLLAACVLAVADGNSTATNTSTVRSFPDGFLFGAATAAYQIEGYWNQSGRSPSIWDHMLHDVKPCFVTAECSNGDDACKSYELWERDVEMVKSLGLDHYRFSISWARILPYGFANETNAEGIAYYNNLINALLENDIEPFVTIYHWDMPQTIQDLGGFANPLIKDWLGDFARICFENFGDRVKYWITINEPSEICYNGYGEGTFAPLIDQTGVADYMCGKNLLMAHANMYHIFNTDYRSVLNGSIGIVLSARWYEPEDNTTENIQAAADYRMFEYGIWATPIYIGNWTTRLSEIIANNSASEGFPRSRLPAFTDAEVQFIYGSSDFFGLNHYTTSKAYRNSSVSYTGPSYDNDVNATAYQPASWQGNSTSWTWDLPWGFYKLLVDINDNFAAPRIFIAENGFASKVALSSSQISDDDRVTYHRGYLGALLDAVDYGCDIMGYTVWSLMDNFSWRRGYSTRFGLFETNITDSNRTRTPRKSAYVYKNIISTRVLNTSYVPDMTADL